MDLRPHKSRYWMTSRDKLENPEVFDAKVAELCERYAQARTLYDAGVHVVSTDEKTGMQAVERKDPTKPTRPGLVERREFEYIRHGTLCLTAHLEVATGRVLAPRIAETRKIPDFVEPIRHTISGDPDGRWGFIVDNLDVHKAAALVRFVAAEIGFQGDLGVKRGRGILQSKESRTTFLTDPTHRIRFVFPPRHGSWLNQVELWFSVLARRVLRRGSFTSKDDLRTKVLDFIAYFNEVLARPYKWTYRGRLLCA